MQKDDIDMIEKLEDKLKMAKEMLSACIPFLETHYRLSIPTMGTGAQNVLKAIKRFLNED